MTTTGRGRYQGTAIDLFRKTSVQELLPEEKRIITVTTDTPISQVFKTLVEKNILSAPVYNTKTHKWVGFVDMLDIVHHVLNVLKISQSELDGMDFDQLISISTKFADAPCGSIVDLSKRNPYLPVDKRAPVKGAIELMIKWRVHRVPVIDSDGELLTLITQSHIARLIYKYLAQFETLADVTVDLLQLGYGEVITIRDDELAIDAFRRIHARGVSAVGVVDAEGKLVGNVSASDLKVIGYNGRLMSRLFIPANEFIELTRPDGVGAITVTPQTNFSQLLDKLVMNRIHRVYVVDDNEKPIGVISLLEILQTFCQ